MRFYQNAKNVSSFFLVIALVIFSTAAPDTLFKILFLLTGFTEIILLFCPDILRNAQNQRIASIVVGIIFMGIFYWSFFSAGSLSAYGGKLLSFFQAPSESGDANARAYEEASRDLSQMKNGLSDASWDVYRILDDLDQLSETLEERQFFAGKYDPAEVEEAADMIREELKKDGETAYPDFADIKTNQETVELFYKMRLSLQPFQYINCVRALESAGIDCQAWAIDEYRLMTWDVEHMFAIYSMRQSILDDVAQGKVYEEPQKFYYEKFRIFLNEHSDTCDYGTWHKGYDPGPAKDIANMMDKTILNFYQKIYMNFQKSSA